MNRFCGLDVAHGLNVVRHCVVSVSIQLELVMVEKNFNS